MKFCVFESEFRAWIREFAIKKKHVSQECFFTPELISFVPQYFQAKINAKLHCKMYTTYHFIVFYDNET